MRVLGVDPGLNCTGYAVVERTKSVKYPLRAGSKELLVMEAGVIRTAPGDTLAVRVRKIYRGLCQVIAVYGPQALVVEELFSHYRNPRTAIMMAHARGVICLAGAEAGLNVYGYAARRVKKAITGSGAADKTQMQRVIKELLGLKKEPSPPDVADALALAVTHLQAAARRV
ncbi:MAG: crossover junction endodeoxyribonuclease RuvC [Candidatus Omnitrophica bacterium]|nr:crossover junction endodeoxyribonuclease RuvC [Candidatus Omnitrophota bacterium]